MKKIPYFAIGNDELNEKALLGKTIACKMCGKRHRVTYGHQILQDGTKELSTALAFYKCGRKSYLAGIDGKQVC